MDLNPKWRWTEGLRKESNYFHVRLSLRGQRSWISLDRWASDNSTKLWWVDTMLTSGDFPLLSWCNNQAVTFFKCWGANFKRKISNWWLLSPYMINNKEKYWIHINKADVGGGGQWTFSGAHLFLHEASGNESDLCYKYIRSSYKQIIHQQNVISLWRWMDSEREIVPD